uniref:Helix-turn-helix transcriptional regulator n=1 Tax=Thermosporothrix sp. COM3 TaxID=2490863 RepID=A0A455SPL0_9CHLR|nr:helix-turn-helix transcriptional regulator [Thermosporothrix sp. COM3]
MPKTATYLLHWVEKQKAYALYEEHPQGQPLLQGDTPEWFHWLTDHTSFSFQGRNGNLNLQKEVRPNGGAGYWYAYRRQGKRTVKKYIGASTRLTIARLESIALLLSPVASSHQQSEAPPLLLPKLQPPRLSSALLIARERLLALLDGIYSHPLTLLVAPAGSGKTTLIRQWQTSCHVPEQIRSISWVSLEKSDNDPDRFWTYVLTALQRFYVGVNDRFPIAFQPPFQKEMLTPFLNELSRHDITGLLILEDYHTITEPVIHEALTFFLDHLPASLHVVLLSRYIPPLPLARWRANGMLQEIQASHLRFTSEETAAFLRQALSLTIPEKTLQQVDAQLQGWAAGLRLLTLTLQGRTKPEVEHSLLHLANTHRPIMDYFINEVLVAQPEALQHFLLQTCVLTRLNSSLCDAVTDSQNTKHLLEEVERAGLFLQTLEGPGQWYQYHELFAEALRDEARRRLGEEALKALLRRACHWYESHDMLDEAIETALAIHEYPYAALLLERYPPTQFAAGWHYTLHRRLAQLPEKIVFASPALCFMYAVVSLFVKDLSVPENRAFLEKLLQQAEQGLSTADDRLHRGAIYTLRALMAWWQDDYVQSFAAARQALSLLPEQEVRWRGMCLLHTSMEEQFAGRFNAARTGLIEARALCAASQNIQPLMTATLMLGDVCFEQGALQQAEHYYQQALSETEDKAEMLDDQGLALLGLARLAYERNDLMNARQKASQALTNGKQIKSQKLQAHAALVLARTLHALGEDEQAWHILQEQVAQLYKPELQRELQIGQAWLALACGNPAAAQQHMAAITQTATLIPFVQREQEMFIKARLFLAQNNPHKALSLLHEWQREEPSRGELEQMALLALAHAQIASTELPTNSLDPQRHAKLLLLKALERAQPEAFQRLFLDAGEHMADILRTILPEIRLAPLHAYASRLVLAFSEPGTLSVTSAAHPLSLQEQRILHLLAAGLSQPAIALELVVSLNTIKTHVKHIYRKLGATNRQEAVTRATTLRLLSNRPGSISP